jgi:membrane protein DedA with SNARE-associated domain/rhodanese-related sulfurtransferase
MEHMIRLFEVHGVLAVFIGVFAEQLGAPIPAVPFLLLAGAQGVDDGVFLLKTLAAAAVASVIADGLWYVAGRLYGRRVLGLLCRISMSPDTCVRRSEASFARRGVLAVLFAKFIPGVSTLAPPLAGALGMRSRTFLLIDLAGTVLWAGAALAAGVLFNRQVREAMNALEQLGNGALVLVAIAVGLYVAWRWGRRLVIQRRLRQAPRISATELDDRLRRGDRISVLDVRSAGGLPYARIPGSIEMPLESPLFMQAGGPGLAGELVTYCDCPNDASAVRAAQLLARSGYSVRVLAGGFSAWVEAGLQAQVEADGVRIAH